MAPQKNTPEVTRHIKPHIDAAMRAARAEFGETVPDPEDLIYVLGQHGVVFGRRRKGQWHPGMVLSYYLHHYGPPPGSPRTSSPIIELSPAGTPFDIMGRLKFRSTYEERVAKALTRLNVAWLYESAHLDYDDWRGNWHTYTPDFTLTDLHMTFVEVKGHGGANGDAAAKMRRVLARHAITLLVWTPREIEMLEDCENASVLVPMLRTTRLAA